jgi:hypothetical protein
MIREIAAERASHGYQRVTALLNRRLEAEGRRGVSGDLGARFVESLIFWVFG